MEKERADERKMDRFLEKQALDYYRYQKGRARDRVAGKSSKTLRTVLAESFQEFLRKFSDIP